MNYSEKSVLNVELQNNKYDWMILGTGLEETMFAAHLAKVQKKKSLQLIIIDFDKSYSRNSKTMNFKEYHNFQKSLYETNEQYEEGLDTKSKVMYQACEQNEEISKFNNIFADFINSGSDFKHFNIDIQPKLLYSTSPTVELMQQADMDQYMDFRAIIQQYYFEVKAKKFIITPTTKSDIFTNKFLSIYEKKHLFQILHGLINLSRHVFKLEDDQNSTDEFQKSTQLDEKTLNIYQKYQDDQVDFFLDYFFENVKNQESILKIKNVLLFAICLFTDSKTIKTKQFLHRLSKFIHSLGVHTKNAFLYTNYGTGDIAQGFSRVAAVYGSDFLLNEKISIEKVEFGEFLEQIQSSENDPQPENQQEEDTKYRIKIQSNLCQKNLFIRDGILISNDFRESFKKMNKIEPSERKYKQQLRISIITTKNPEKLPDDLKKECLLFNKQEQVIENKQRPQQPTLFIIPPQSEVLHHQNPAYIFRTDNNSNSTHKNYEIFYFQTIIDKQEESLKIIEDVSNLVQKMDIEYLEDSTSASFNLICYICSYIIKVDEEDDFYLQDQLPVYVTSSESSVMDFDDLCENFKNHLKQINLLEGDSKIFQIPLNSSVPSPFLQEEEESKMNHLLNKLSQLTQNQTDKNNCEDEQ